MAMTQSLVHTVEATERRERRPLASGLAWFGIGLGLAHLLAPRPLARVIVAAVGGVLLVDAFAARRSGVRDPAVRRLTALVTIDRSLEDVHRGCRENAETRDACERLERLGKLEFSSAPGGRGTVARVELETTSAAGIAASIAALFGRAPGQNAQRDLRRLKQLLEIGWVVESDASLRPRPRPARPARGPQPPLAFARNTEVRP